MHPYLENVPEEKGFIADGMSLESLGELRDYLMTIDDISFSRYAGEDFNYFSNWIHDIIKDKHLAEEIKGKTREQTIEVIKKRIKELSNNSPHKENPHHEHDVGKNVMDALGNDEPISHEKLIEHKKKEREEEQAKKPEVHTEHHAGHNDHKHQEPVHHAHNKDKKDSSNLLFHIDKESRTVFLLGLIIGLLFGIMIMKARCGG